MSKSTLVMQGGSRSSSCMSLQGAHAQLSTVRMHAGHKCLRVLPGSSCTATDCLLTGATVTGRRRAKGSSVSGLYMGCDEEQTADNTMTAVTLVSCKQASMQASKHVWAWQGCSQQQACAFREILYPAPSSMRRSGVS